MFAAMAAESGCRPRDITAMAAALPGRGELLSRGDPAHAVWVDPSGAFAAACRSLPWLPEDPLDIQPAVDRELIFVCRARLDDRAGLLQLLQIDATRGATFSDAQILQQCYKKWREATPQHVYGDFAFVAWERWSRRTVAATDHLGNFPLFYRRTGGRILFASQLSALLACPNLRANLDTQCLAAVAAGEPLPGRTMFEGIEILQGGHLLVHHEEVVRIEKWWNPDTTARDVHPHARDYVDEARILFDSAVVSRLRSRGGVVAALNGGLDSALVAVTAARHLSAGGKVLEALTATAHEDAAWATHVAESEPNIRQRMVSSGDMTPLDILPLAHQIALTPVADPAGLVWTWQMTARAAHNRVRVILSAEHGSRSIGYAGNLCDSHFARLRRFAGAAQQTWDRVRCLGMNPRGVHSTRSADETPAGTRADFARTLLTARSPARVDFMVRFGVEWLDPTTDRKLLERLLTFPLHVFRVGNRSAAEGIPRSASGATWDNRPQGLARELGRGRLTESVRLRRASATYIPDQTAWFVQRSADYRRAFQGLRDSTVCTEFLDLASLNAVLEGLCSGNGTAVQAATLHRALAAGLFAAALESEQGIGTSPTPLLFESVADMRRISTAR